MNADKKVSFLLKIYKNSKNWHILGLPFGLETYWFECIAQRNNIKKPHVMFKEWRNITFLKNTNQFKHNHEF